ncbi:hypothetical protein AB0D04_28685 [Streptomyces sp. NPDC048483]|uniref:hypothetical protein n=1 Tax=Streptomyces sp. NPDC048483 TaxID=3154927 RepID=UPI00343DED3A
MTLGQISLAACKSLMAAARRSSNGHSCRLQPTVYDLPDGHRLALVVNSRDRLYSFTETDGSTTTVSSPNGNDAGLQLPLG